MNYDKIDLLALRATDDKGGLDRHKFAELIVQECMNVLHDNELWNRHISHVLKEHFGVEE